MPEEEKEYLTWQEATKYLGVSKAPLGNYVKRGLIKRYERKVPREVFYKKSELDALRQIRPKDS